MPKRVDHQRRRTQIGEAVLRIASHRGLQAATLREVAVEAGVSLRVVQYYFRDKAELLQAALDQLGEQMTAHLQDALGALGPAPAHTAVVRATLQAILPTDARSDHLFRAYTAFYTVLLVQPEVTPADAASQPTALERFLASQLRAAQQENPTVLRVDPDLAAAGLLALANGLSSSILGGQRDTQAALAVLEYHLTAVLGLPTGDGLRPRDREAVHDHGR